MATPITQFLQQNAPYLAQQTMSKHVRPGIGKTLLLERYVWWQSKAGLRIGYARVSTDDQTLDLQRDALARAKCRKIYEEHASGKNTTRPELEACLKSLREGDTLVIWRLDRLGRSLGDLIELSNELQSRRIDLESLTEKLIPVRQQESLFFMCLVSWPSLKEISFASGPLLGLRLLALVDVKVADRESSNPKSSKQSVLY